MLKFLEKIMSHVGINAFVLIHFMQSWNIVVKGKMLIIASSPWIGDISTLLACKYCHCVHNRFSFAYRDSYFYGNLIGGKLELWSLCDGVRAVQQYFRREYVNVCDL